MNSRHNVLIVSTSCSPFQAVPPKSPQSETCVLFHLQDVSKPLPPLPIAHPAFSLSKDYLYLIRQKIQSLKVKHVFIIFEGMASKSEGQ